MTSASKTFGRPPTYHLGAMAVGDTINLPVPTPADVKRVARNTSQYGLRHERCYRCRTNSDTRVITITRVR